MIGKPTKCGQDDVVMVIKVKRNCDIEVFDPNNKPVGCVRMDPGNISVRGNMVIHKPLALMLFKDDEETDDGSYKICIHLPSCDLFCIPIF